MYNNDEIVGPEDGEILLDPESMIDHLVKMKEMIEHPPIYLDQSKEQLKSLFLHASGLRNAIIEKWEKKGFSESEPVEVEKTVVHVEECLCGCGDYEE